MRENPQRPVATGTFAKTVFDRLYAETQNYFSPMYDPKKAPRHHHPLIRGDKWSNSLSCNPKIGVRKLRIRLTGGWDSYRLQQPLPEEHVADLWLQEMQNLIQLMGATRYVKVYKFMGIPSLAIWYESNT